MKKHFVLYLRTGGLITVDTPRQVADIVEAFIIDKIDKVVTISLDVKGDTAIPIEFLEN